MQEMFTGPRAIKSNRIGKWVNNLSDASFRREIRYFDVTVAVEIYVVNGHDKVISSFLAQRLALLESNTLLHRREISVLNFNLYNI